MILHFYLHWPQRFRLDIWPYSVYYAVWIWNYFSDTTTPIEVFNKAAFLDHKHLQRTRVFGCPVYVLAPTLQDAKKLPKWHKRSWKGVFLEFSPLHHTTVALVLNPDTGNITPQYHVVFDETFSTISSSTGVRRDILNDFLKHHNDSAPAIKLWNSLLDEGYGGSDIKPPPVHTSPVEILPPSNVPEPSVPTETEIRPTIPTLSSSESSPTNDGPTQALWTSFHLTKR
jgi:hypothetical protein